MLDAKDAAKNPLVVAQILEPRLDDKFRFSESIFRWVVFDPIAGLWRVAPKNLHSVVANQCREGKWEVLEDASVATIKKALSLLAQTLMLKKNELELPVDDLLLTPIAQGAIRTSKRGQKYALVNCLMPYGEGSGIEVQLLSWNTDAFEWLENITPAEKIRVALGKSSLCPWHDLPVITAEKIAHADRSSKYCAGHERPSISPVIAKNNVVPFRRRAAH